MTMSDYTTGIKELDDAVGGIKKGSNILFIGPPMSRKEVILNSIMYHSAAKNENAVITVTTRESAAHFLEWFGENKLDLPLSRIGIVDCVTKADGGVAVENENIKIASNPVDLTGIGVRISQFFDAFVMKKNIRKVQLHINSLSTILMYSNIQTVFRFKSENDKNFIRLVGMSSKPTPWLEYEIEGANLMVMGRK